jgi:hypothetical protein
VHDREFFRMMKDRPKNVGWSAAPADGILAAHCRPNGKLGTSVERAAFGQKYITPHGRGSHTDRAV